MNRHERGREGLGLAALASIGVGGMVGGGIFSVLGLTVQIAGAGALIFLGYEGFELIANAAEDARDPGRTLPRAYLIAIGGVIVLYVLVAFVAVGNLSPRAIATGSDYALAAAARPGPNGPG